MAEPIRHADYERTILLLTEFQGERCFYCGRHLTPRVRRRPSEADRTIDHIIPQSRGGGSNFANLCLCCRGCNEAKGDLMPWEWLSPIESGEGVAVG